MRSARLVGWAMRHCPDDVPAHRVVNASGVLSGGWAFGHPSIQRARLEAEGVRFVAEERRGRATSASHNATRRVRDAAENADLPILSRFEVARLGWRKGREQGLIGLQVNERGYFALRRMI